MASPSKYSTVSTMCSSVLGPAIPPPLVTWPTTTTAVPLSLAKRMSWPEHSRTWPTLPGALSSDSVYTVWIESMTTTSAETRGRRREDGLEPGLAQHVHGARVLVDQALGAEPDLVRGFLAAGVEHRPAGRLEPGRGLEQQRGLADAGLAADEDHRAGHEASAQHEVELREPGAPALQRRAGDVAEPGGRRDDGGRRRGPASPRRDPGPRGRRPAPPPRSSRRRRPRSGRPTWGARGRSRCSGRWIWVWAWSEARAGGPAGRRADEQSIERGSDRFTRRHDGAARISPGR